MKAKKPKLGVLGVGSMGKNHARVLCDLAEKEICQKPIVYDIDPKKAKNSLLSLPNGERILQKLEVTHDFAEFAKKIDAAIISVPTKLHYKFGKILLKLGKSLLIEKPLASSLEEAQELVKLAEEKHLALQVGHIERFNPIMSRLEKTLNSPRFIETHRLSPFPARGADVGVVLDLMIHDLEILLHLVKSPIESVDAVGVSVLTGREDIANARIRFANACVANLTASRISPEKMRKFRVFQSDCYLSLDYQKQEGRIHSLRDGKIAIEEVKVKKDEPLKLELSSFINCLGKRENPKVGGNQAAQALKLALQITKLANA